LFFRGSCDFVVEFGIHKIIEDDFEVFDEFGLFGLTLADLFLFLLEFFLKDRNRHNLIVGKDLIPEFWIIYIRQVVASFIFRSIEC
jgi:hypothetical protein